MVAPLTPDELVSPHLLEPCKAPIFTVGAWGDYPDYVSLLQLALDKCNTDKAAIARLLRIKMH
ncbi:hypothetical protein EPIR_0570 [Erwinia piriflorinigrans CFBP 5888]|uniref:Uncharacterized protein n=1 Tax=Erwinia piriflorinigrans CFBP 5888 TaxID=1161919 RepID=V5Z3P1_9GAMM|nr:hypothetical protein EPIR_0570 [Erwinia piriflorinigrans CFBP 5888]